MATISAADMQVPQLFAELSVEKMPAHWLMARLGKRVLRPGGLDATRWLLDQCQIGRNDDVVEFAPGLGVTARLVAHSAPRSYTGIERDRQAAAFATAALHRARVESARIVRGDAAAVPLPDSSASVLIGEAMLSMQPQEHKFAILSEARRLLRPNGRYAIHELAILPDDIDAAKMSLLQYDLSKEIHVGVRIGTVREWQSWVTDAGFSIEATANKPMKLLEPDRLIRDEGVFGMAKFLTNVARTPGAARRLLRVRAAFRKYSSNLCAVAIVAKRR